MKLTGGPVIISTGIVGVSLESRVEALEQALKSFQQESGESTRRLEANLGEVNKSVEQEREQRITASDSTSRQIEQLAVGGLHLEVVGLLWLLAGTLLSNMPDEISKLII